MIKTILALAVTAAAYLIAGDAGAATTTLDLDEPVMVRGRAGTFIMVDAPRHWSVEAAWVTFGAVFGNAQQATWVVVSVDCRVPQAIYIGNPRMGIDPERVSAARGTLSRQMTEHICATINFDDRPMRAY